VIDNKPDLFVGFVARMGFERRGENMRIGDRLFRREYDAARRCCADMAEIAQNTDTVRLGDDFVPKAAQPGVAPLIAAGAREVLGIVGDLHDTDAEFLEEFDVAELILKRRGVLEPEDDPGLTCRFGPANIRRIADRSDQVGIVGEPALPLRDIAHRVDKPLPDRAGAVRSGHAALAHVGKDGAAPFRDDETVDDGERVVQACHGILHRSADALLAVDFFAGLRDQFGAAQIGSARDLANAAGEGSARISQADRMSHFRRSRGCCRRPRTR